MSYIAISTNECFNTSRVIINNNSNNFDQRLTSLTNNYNFYLNEKNTLNDRVFGANRILQQVIRTYNDPGDILAYTDVTRANLQAVSTTDPHISITKIEATSDLLIEISGGRWKTRTRRGLLTYFFGRTGSNSYDNLFDPWAVQFQYFDTGGGNIYGQGQHYARAVYTGNEPSLDVDIYVQGSGLSVNEVPLLWNTGTTIAENIPAVSFVLSITEIATT